ncbi:Hypothetical protein CINCED_3A022493 [Cinara cedri]|uniref:Uncharacterized protein n=1 Tax=Cinara cedri TaxID=506608 RepID=A0A5E4N179_9HEMI|nr:Hypothetical protein CINCED_3A022493 [Cinara cedri]
MNNDEKVELVLIYGECQGNILLVAGTLLQGLNEEGRFPDRQINQQKRRANMFDEDTELQKYKMHPYKIDFVQHLGAADPIRRLEFIAWFSIQFHNDLLIINHILCSDESKCTNNGIMNKQNYRYWADTNPHWSRETNFQMAWGINVWCGLVGGKLGLFFYEGTLNDRRYKFLINELSRLLNDVPLDTREQIVF